MLKIKKMFYQLLSIAGNVSKDFFVSVLYEYTSIPDGVMAGQTSVHVHIQYNTQGIGRLHSA